MNMIPPITIVGDSGSPASMLHSSSIKEPSPREANGITAITITSSACTGGDVSGAALTISAPSLYGYRQATGTYTIVNHVITAVVLTDGGCGYLTLPTITTGGDGGTLTAIWADGNYRGEWHSVNNKSFSVNAIVNYGHRMYKSLQNSNIGYIPGAAGNDTWWLDWGATEKWSPFDGATGSQAEAPDQVTYELYLPGESVDSVTLLNIECASTQVIMKNGHDGATVKTWNETTLVDGLFVSDVVATDFDPAIANPHLLISIDYAGSTAKIGEIVVGLKESIGSTLFNPSVGITDYSIKEVDAFGNYTILERAYSKRLSCETRVQNTQLDAVYNVLAENRAKAAVWVGSEDYPSMIVYGFYKDFSIEIPYEKLGYSICTLEVEGLV